MIGDGAFNDQINRAAGVLSDVGLLEKREFTPSRNVQAAAFRGLSYRQTWERTIQEFAYDFILTDQSLLHFTKAGRDVHDGRLSYSFWDCPVEVQTYDAFCADWLEVSPLDENYEDELGVWSDSLRQEYERYVNTCDSRPVTPIRYDYSASAYMPGRHPTSHVHFGFQNHIRVATRKVLMPLSFVLFIVRQRYPEQWMRVLVLDEERHLCREVRDALDSVHENYWHEMDQHEMTLG